MKALQPLDIDSLVAHIWDYHLAPTAGKPSIEVLADAKYYVSQYDKLIPLVEDENE